MLSERPASSVLAIIFAVGLGACSASDEQSAPVQVRPAKLIQVGVADALQEHSLPAVIEAARSTDLTFAISGLVEQLEVREGQQVSSGQVIARLDQRALLNDLSAAQAQFNNAKTEYDRASRLVEQNAIAGGVVDQRRTQLDVARAQLDTAQKRMDDSVLRAPFAGIVALVHVEQFENVSAATPIATLQTLGAGQALVQMPATIVANAGRVTPYGSQLTLDALPGQAIAAELHSVATQADPRTQTFAIRFDYAPPAGSLVLPGMTGMVRIRFGVEDEGPSANRIEVPLEAVQADGEDRYVWVVATETGEVTRRRVDVGAGVGDMLTVASGLSAGETVVGAGAPYLQPGMRVRPLAE